MIAEAASGSDEGVTDTVTNEELKEQLKVQPSFFTPTYSPSGCEPPPFSYGTDHSRLTLCMS